MLFKQFQDLQLSSLGFGTMRLPLQSDGSIDQAELDRMVDSAVVSGINYFDTAHPYHGGKSEVAIGKSLARYPREQWYLADKFPGHQNVKGVKELMAEGNYKAVVAAMLNKEGLNYGQLPKGMLLFHKYPEGARTPMEEHLVEGALYAASNGEANVHFTVSHEHIEFFENKVAEKKDMFAEKYGIKYNISFSEQKPSTDTIAANPDNTPFRNEDGSLLFRPGGHGALIQNLNDIDADVIFIKNIDNVVPDRLKQDTVDYKQIIAGVLVTLQKQAFEYLKVLNSGEYNHEKLEEIIKFVQRDICCRKPDIKDLEDADLVIYLKEKLNRPMRVCGVVKNVGEPGGGPFLTYNQDGTVSLQILESSQIDKSNEEYMKMFSCAP